MALATLISCGKDDPVNNNDKPIPIQPGATIEICTSSKAPITGSNFGTGNDVFRLSAFESENAPTDWTTSSSNHAFENLAVNSTDGTLTLSTTKYYPLQGKLWFYAYAPSTDNGYTKGSSSSAPTVSYTITGQEDIMTGKVTSNGFDGKNGSQPSFTFKHLLQKVTFKVIADKSFEETDVKVKSIAVTNVKTGAQLNIVTGALSFSGDANQSLTLNKEVSIEKATEQDAGSLMFEPSQTFNISVTYGESTTKSLPITLEGDNAGKAGVSHVVTLKFLGAGGGEVNIQPSATITEWETGSHITTPIQ